MVCPPLLDLPERRPPLEAGTSPDGCGAGVGRALGAPATPDARRALARPFDWDALAARMVDEIERRL